MRLPRRPVRAARLAVPLLLAAAVCAPGLWAQSSTASSAYDSGLDRSGASIPKFDSGLSSADMLRDTAPVPRPVYFPPEAPPLDFAITSSAPRYSSSRPAPSELAAYVREPFYPELAARIDRYQLTARQRDALHRYHDEKSLLQHNLRTELAYILTQAPGVRGPLFADLAQKQDPQILALEARAEEFRSSLFRSEDAWTAARKPVLTDTARPANDPDDIAHAMLGAAFFQNGLSSAQRTILREIAIEVMSGADSAAAAALAQPYAFFSPGPSRVMFPTDLPAAVGAKLADYQTKKSALRKELYDAIYREDATWFGLVRTARFKALAEKQAPQFAALETLAEEIRRELPPAPAPRVAAPPASLPAGLVGRIGALHQQQFTALREINRQFEQYRANQSALRATTIFNAESQRYQLQRVYRNYATESKDFVRAKPRYDALMDAYDEMDAALTGERNAIRRDIAAALHTEDPARITLALADGVGQSLEQRIADAMKDCHLAVLEPGLSPAQRRLLFDYAVENLDLPLPRAVMQSPQRLQQLTASLDR